MHNRPLASLAAALLVSLGAAGCATNSSPARSAEILVADAQIAAELNGALPATVTFTDRMGAAGFARLPAPLDLDAGDLDAGDPDAGDRVRDYQARDVAYWPAGQSIIVFRHSGSGAVEGEELIALGEVTTGFAAVADCVRDCPIRLTATVTATDDEGEGAEA